MNMSVTLLAWCPFAVFSVLRTTKNGSYLQESQSSVSSMLMAEREQPDTGYFCVKAAEKKLARSAKQRHFE